MNINIISGTNRPGSRTLQVAKKIQELFLRQKVNADIIDLQSLPLNELTGAEYWQNQPPRLLSAVEQVARADGLVVVTPEYNGSIPGALKYFIDHWKFPDCFEYRPVAFVGLGGRFGGLRPVEHLQQILGYRSAFIYPDRVFLMNAPNIIKDGEIQDPVAAELLVRQAQGFIRFVKGLKSEELDANSVLRKKTL